MTTITITSICHRQYAEYMHPICRTDRLNWRRTIGEMTNARPHRVMCASGGEHLAAGYCAISIQQHWAWAKKKFCFSYVRPCFQLITLRFSHSYTLICLVDCGHASRYYCRVYVSCLSHMVGLDEEWSAVCARLVKDAPSPNGATLLHGRVCAPVRDLAQCEALLY